ncbi:MAG: hypothetical protein GY941_21785 [Planctomycetes bacterium]|nr:hypothetical protein [Planctomycetota bacterium]
MMICKDIYATVRKTNGRHWIDTRTISHSIDIARQKTKRENKACGPYWYKDNPAQYISTINITVENNVYNLRK